MDAFPEGWLRLRRPTEHRQLGQKIDDGLLPRSALDPGQLR